MKKHFNRKDIPFYLTSLFFIVVLVLWFFPNKLGLINSQYSIQQFRSDLKDLANLFYIVITLWLVLVTRKMAEVSLNSQKAFNRPEILCELFISTDKPDINHFTGIKNIEIRNTNESIYLEGQEGASIFLILKNRYGGGKAINLKISLSLEATNPEGINISRQMDIDYLAEGDAIAIYLYKFSKPSVETSSLRLTECKLRFTTPFNEASKDPFLFIVYNQTNQILATGNLTGAIKLAQGIRIND